MIQPTFVTHLPKELVPLAKLSPGRSGHGRKYNGVSSSRLLHFFPMTTEAIKTAVQSRPFRPFTVRLANGLQIQIQSEEHVAVHPDGKTFVIFEPNGGYRIV